MFVGEESGDLRGKGEKESGRGLVDGVISMVYGCFWLGT
jgi:hypothetical protein